MNMNVNMQYMNMLYMHQWIRLVFLLTCQIKHFIKVQQFVKCIFKRKNDSEVPNFTSFSEMFCDHFYIVKQLLHYHHHWCGNVKSNYVCPHSAECKFVHPTEAITMRHHYWVRLTLSIHSISKPKQKLRRVWCVAVWLHKRTCVWCVSLW